MSRIRLTVPLLISRNAHSMRASPLVRRLRRRRVSGTGGNRPFSLFSPMEKPLSPTSPSDGAPAPGVLLCLAGAEGSGGAGRGQLSQAERATRALSDGRLPLEPLEIRLLAATLDYPATLRAVAAAFVPRFAAWGFLS